jgi:diphthine-ammonia ligase
VTPTGAGGEGRGPLDASGLRDLPFVCSWSGGKDSCLAYHAAVRAGGVPRWLLCMTDETGARTRSHALPVEFVRRQAAALGLPLMVRSATWEQYEDQFIAALRELAADGVRAGVFGDIDIEDHRAWEEKVCAAAGLAAFLPLWGMPRRMLVDEVFAAGIRATIVTTEARVLDDTFIGRELTPLLVGEIEAAGSDAAGELGEYHTAVTDAPLFAAPVPLQVRGTIRAPGHWHAELTVAPAADADRSLPNAPRR